MKTKITISVFVALLLAFFVIGVVMPEDEQSAVNENRTLKEMPELTSQTLFSGTFSREFEEYLADNVGMRSKFTAFSSKVNEFKGIKTNFGNIVSVKKDLGAGGESNESSRLLVLGDRIMEIYKDKPESGAAYAAAVNKYADTFSGKANVYSMLIPTQIEFAADIYAKSSDSQKTAIDRIYGAISDDVVKVNAYDVMKENAGDYIYFRTDHHWTQRGAYLAYSKFAEAAGHTPVELSSLKLKTADGFLGFLYNQANDTSLANKPDTIEWFEGDTNYAVKASTMENGKVVEYNSRIYVAPEGTPKYSVFMGGDHSLAEINTDVPNGKTVLVIKDSYANALLPLLTNNYTTVLAVDPRSYYGTVDELVEKYDVDDILIMNYIFTTTFDDFIEKIDTICR